MNASIGKLDSEDPRINEQLIAQIRESIVPGILPYFYDRAPKYSSFASQQGKTFSLFGALDDQQKILGFTQITEDEVYYSTQTIEVRYSGDTRVTLLARGQKLADRLIGTSCAGPKPVFGVVLGSNTLVLNKKLTDWKKVDVHFELTATMKCLLFKAQKHTRKAEHLSFQIRSAKEEDLKAMHSLWTHQNSQLNLARAYVKFEDFKKSYLETPGVSLAHTYLVIQKNGEFLAFLSLWDQSDIRKMRVSNAHLIIRWLAPVLRAYLNLDPARNAEMKIFYAFQHCFKRDLEEKLLGEVLRELIVTCQVETHNKQGSFFALGLDKNDPVYPMLKSKAQLETEAHLIVDKKKSLPETRPNALFQFEVGIG